MKNSIKILTGLLALSMLFSGCNSSAGKETGSNASQSESKGKETKEEKVVLSYYGPISGIVTDGVQSDDVSKKIEEETGITLSLYASQDEAALNAMFASGDVPDLIDFSGMGGESSVTSTNRLIENNRVMKMNDLLDQYGPDIKEMKDFVQFCKEIYGNGTGDLYVLQGYISPKQKKSTDGGKGLTLRFDYYAEMGYPEIKSADDWLNVVSKMLEAHPTTDSGEKRYGFSTFFEWGNLMAEYGDVVFAIEGKSIVSGRTGLLEYNLETNETRDYVSNVDSSLWKGTELFYKANQMGILDPDIYINKWDTMLAKGDRILTQQFEWTYAEFNI